MKKLVMIIGLTMISTVMMSQKVNDNISLAGDELMKYKKKQGTSVAATIIGSGLFLLGAVKEEAKPMMYIGGGVMIIGVTINISSLSNLGRSANYLRGKKE
jgi:hypothetical protein